MTTSTTESVPIDLKYVGFWPRVGAELVDVLIYAAIAMPLLTYFYGLSYWTADDIIHGPMDVLLSYVVPPVATIWFWVAKQATPGKMVIRAKIVDARTGMVPTTGQHIGRYFAYILSTIPLFLGFIWIAIDARKQGWHDKLAGTVVVSPLDVERKTVDWD
ncbi:MAG: RDD family protein [Rhodothermaceae bacterium]|nr:RDD family protein [Rhodothermaceae bacterium]MXW32061.1 RDD family protein [Rhodothermaceae bacterium]MXX97771.1 RDD family protein [Rhodothermaceae bacterium]MXZ18500.1 RDD family protein [Rhodothermaceae bacterium]MXZ57856.1 RDD family protein [Rhodothermaceae bacterium]